MASKQEIQKLKKLGMSDKDIILYFQQQKFQDKITLMKGDDGIRGEKGEIGLTGASIQGKTGNKGDIGKTGKVGSRGEKGDKGKIGKTGKRGFMGWTGKRGKVGPKGDTGKGGKDGIDGKTIIRQTTGSGIGGGGGSGIQITSNGVNKRMGASKINFGTGLTVTPTPNGVDVAGFSVETQSLQAVTDIGNTTTNDIEAKSFITTSGTSSGFVKGDGSLDTSTYLTAEADTLQTVTDRGASTTNKVTITDEGLASSYIDFDTAATPGHQEGRLHWDDDNGTLELGMAGGEVKMQMGQEVMLPRGKATGSDIDNGELVYISGASGNKPELTLAKADASATAEGTIAMATEDISQNSNGYYTAFGMVNDIPVPVATYSDGDEIYLSATTAGAITNVKPVSPNYAIKVGFVMLAHNTAGKIFINVNPRTNDVSNIAGLTANYVPYADANGFLTEHSGFQYDGDSLNIDRLEILGDNVVNRISYPLSGMSAFQQTLNLIVDGVKVYMETERVTTGGDLFYVIDEEKVTLDCTTGAGTDGMAQVELTVGTAQVELTVGTATAPQINYIYVTTDGAGTATLESSTSLPTGTFAWHSIAVIQDAATVTAHGPISLQRTTEALKHNGRGALSYMREKLRWLGPKYVSGCASTLDDGAAMNLSVAAGVVFQLHRQDFPALNVVTHGATVANASGDGVLTMLENVHDLNDITELANGTPIGTNKYFSITIWATMASSDQNGNQSKLFVNLPTGVYNSESAVIADASNFDVRTAAQEYNNTAFLLCRVTFKKTAGDHDPVGAEVYALTGSPMGTIGGGAGSTALTEFSDANFKVYDNGDPTRIIALEAGSITAGNTRTITMADSAVDLADIGTNTTAIGLNTTHRTSNGTDHSYIDQSVVSGATPTFTNTNFTEATDKNYVTDAQQTVIGNTTNTNSGDQTIELTEEVTGSGTGSFVATIADNVVDEANLKVNSPTNDYVLTSDDGEAGGMKWAEAPGGIDTTAKSFAWFIN